ncbi:MAG TPA: large conductance mechanosensitive channel protein MscL [Candidatus Paceibacterota bacterium]|nr:large conductance mechanosensitive channel protein MscL [Candidatus Paceibacterota bacterium]
MIKEFKKFLFRGNVVDLLVGVVIGTSFGALVNAFVSDLITPFIAIVIKIPDLSKLTFSINGSIFMYGHLINVAISFILVAGVIFYFIVKPISVIMARNAKKSEIK